jgi:DNA-binding response OmpR family regulator
VKLLLVEDDLDLRLALQKLLTQWGYASQGASDQQQALDWLATEAFDLVLLDLGLPQGDGLEICRRLRQRPGHQPLVLMLTARDSTPDKVIGFEMGADDYLVKPFEPAELQARLRALLRRCHQPPSDPLTWGPLQLIPGQSTIAIGGHSHDITRKEALLLELLLRRGGQTCSKIELLNGSSDGRRDVGEETIKAHMHNLRLKLTAAGCPPDLIETVYGLGYRLNPTALP